MSYTTQRKRPLARSRLSQGVSLGTALLAGFMTTSASAADSVTLPEISVTAHQESTVSQYQSDNLSSPKFTQPVSQTPQTIQVINQEIMQDQHATTLTEALRNSPGVGTFFVGENGSTSTGDSVFMRGFDTSNSIFVDGVRNTGAISRDTFDTEQVEVIKGPDGADYGRIAPSGSINMVTKQAQRGNDVEGNVSVGTSDQKRITLDANHQVNSTTAVRLNVMGENSGVPGRDFVRNKSWGIAPAITFGLGTDTRLKLNYLHVTQNNVPDGGVLTIGLPGYSSPDPTRPQLGNASKVDSSNFYGSTHDFNNVQEDMITALFEQDFGDNTTFHNTARWGRTHQDYLLSSFMASSSYLTTPDINDPSTWTMRLTPNFLNQTNTILTDQAGIVQQLKTGPVQHTFSYGLELTQEKAETIGMGAPLNSSFVPTTYTVSIYDPQHDDPGYYGVETGANGEGIAKTAALYWFDNMAFGKRLLVTTGLRLDHNDISYSNSLVCGSKNVPACTSQTYTTVPGVDASDSENLFTWQVGAVYQLNDHGNLYADYAVAAQPPGGDTLTLSTGASTNSGTNQPDLDPQKAKTAEVGTKWKLVDDRLLLTAALYRTTVTNQLAKDLDGTYYQIGEKRVQGVELSAVGQITRNWNVSAGFTTMQTHTSNGAVSSATSGSAPAADGSAVLAYTPKSAFTSWTTYRLPFGLVIGGGASYAGEMQRGSDSAVGTPAYTDSYWVANAMASYPVTKDLGVQLNVYNITNKDYVAAINKSGYRYIPGTPRSAVLSVNYKFD